MIKSIQNNFITFHYLLKTFNHLKMINFFIQVGAHDGIMHDPLYPFLSKNEFRNSGCFFGLAVATKLSFALILPFPIIYLWQNKRLSRGIKTFLKYLFFGIETLVLSSFLFSLLMSLS